MSKPNPYCPRTLRMVAARLRAEAKVSASMAKDPKLPGGSAVFGGASIICSSFARDLLSEARAIERKGKT